MKTLVMLAPNIPLFDTNAGDYRIYRMLKILSEKYRVFFSCYRSHVPEIRYLDALKKNGVRVLEWTDLKKFFVREKVDTVIFEFCGTVIRFLRCFNRLPGCRRIIDSHRIGFLEKFPERPDLKSSRLSREEELGVYKRADILLAVTDRERDIISRETGVRSETLITGINLPRKVRERKGRKGIVFTGSMNNFQNQDAVIYFTERIYPLIKERVPGVEFTIVGNNPSEKVRGLEGGSLRVTGYVPDTEVYASSALISVAPLRICSGLQHKIIEAAAYGTPVVATPAAAAGPGLINGREVLVSGDAEGFASHIISLYNESEIWQKISSGGYGKIKENYTLEIMRERLLEIV